MESEGRRASFESAGHDPRRLGRSIIRKEAQALFQLADQLDDSFCRATDLLLTCGGNVVVTGIGKAGLIGQKIAATLTSTGTPSHFLHPAEAIHGDLGRIHKDDVVLVLSHSGETDEVVRILPSLQQLGVPIVAITGSRESQLSRRAHVILWIGTIEEAGQWKLAPSTSTTAMLALGDALALSTSQRRGFRPEDFARFHPGGSLGLKLSRVEELMRPLERCRVARQDRTVREVLTTLGRPGRRPGAVLLMDGPGMLVGIFTDSDLARLLEKQQDDALDRPISQVMTRSPMVVSVGTMMSAALELLADRKISELPVVDSQGCPVGLIDITDVVGSLPMVDPALDRPIIQGTPGTVDYAAGLGDAGLGDAELSAEDLEDDDGPRILPWPNQSGNDS